MFALNHLCSYLKRVGGNVIILTAFFSLLVSTVVLALSGDLDTTFDSDGLVMTNVVPSKPESDNHNYGVAIQSNGKIVAAGYSAGMNTYNYDFALTRYNTDGSLDTTFSGDGRLITNFGGHELAWDVAVQSNGKIVASGTACDNNGGYCNVALARYNSNGTLDTTFSGDGKQTTDFGGGSNGSYGGLAIQSDGKIVVAGYMSNGTDRNFAIYRYNTNGTLDTTFSGDGISVGNFGLSRQDIAYDLLLQSDGKIVVAGATGDVNDNNFAAVRLNPNGTADTTFSGDGRQTTNFGGNDFAYGVALQPDGKIVLVGHKITETRFYFAIARYNTNGSLDTTFNGTGRRVFSINSGFDSWANDVIVQSNGKIVVLGTADISGDYDFAVVRLNSGGGFDTTFSGDGKVTVNFSGLDYGSSLTLQPLDHKYLLGGNTNYGVGVYDFALARVLP